MSCLDKKGHKRMILEVILHFFTKRFSTSSRENIWAKEFGSDIEWTQDRVFLIHLSTGVKKSAISYLIFLQKKLTDLSLRQNP